MRIKSLSLGFSAGTVIAIAFGVCGLFFAIAPTTAAAFVSWLIHVDMTGMTREISAFNLLAAIIVFGAYAGLLVGLIAAFYNRLTTPRSA